MGRLDGRAAVITGAARGIGQATARLFVSEGASVVIADVLDDEGQALSEELGDRAAFIHTDVTAESDIQAAIDLAQSRFGKLDIMFNNAGAGGARGPIDQISVEGFDDTFNLLLRSVFIGMKLATPVMRAQGGGSIVSTASIAGIGTEYGPHLYNTAKAAVIHLTRSVAKELGPDNIRVNCVCPGFVATPIFTSGTNFTLEQVERSVEQVASVLSKRQPIQRSGRAEDIAEAVLWLASDAASFVTGHDLVIDGGITHGRTWEEAMAKREELAEKVREIAGS